MATATSSLLPFFTQYQQDPNLTAKLVALIRSDIADFDELSDVQKKDLGAAAILAGFKTNLELFLFLKLHPEAIGLPPLPPEKLETAIVNAQTLAALVAEYRDQELLKKNVDTVFKNRSEKDRALIQYLTRQATIKRQIALWAQLADPKTQDLISSLNREADPKNPPLPQIQKTDAEIIATAATQTGVPFSQSQITEGANLLTAVSIAGLVNYTDPTSTSLALQAVLGDVNPAYHTPVTETLRQIEANISTTPTPNYANPSITHLTPNVAITLGRVSLPSTEITTEAAAIVLPPPLQDKAETLQTLAEKYTAKIVTNPKTETVFTTVARAIPADQEKQFTRLLIAANLVSRIAPTQAGAAAARAVAGLNPVNPFISSAVIRWHSMGADPKTIETHVKKNISSPLANFIHHNPGILTHFLREKQLLANPENKLGEQTAPPPRAGLFAGLAARYQSLTNTVSGFLPDRAASVFNLVTHPIQSLQNYLGNVVGQRFVDKFKDIIVEKFINNIANETLAQAGRFVLKEGLQKGAEKLAGLALEKLGGTALVAGISTALGISTAGASLVVQAALMLGTEVVKKVGGAVMGLVNGFSRALTDKDFDWRAAAAAPLALLTGTGGLIGSFGSAASIAAASAGVILLFSTLLGFFLYIVVIAVAPIITTIAQLESGLGPQQGPAFGAFPYQPYTGPILPGCSQIWPVTGGYVIQGPHGTYSHQSLEAADIYAAIGTPVKSMSSGIVSFAGWGDAYGNMITVRSTSENGKSYTVLYAHLSEIGVSVGDPVGVGTVIALSGATSSVPGFANPHLHLEYRGIAYNSCPAGGIQLPDGCYSAIVGTPNGCLINGKPIYTD